VGREKKKKLLRSPLSDPVCYCFMGSPSYCGGPYGPNDPLIYIKETTVFVDILKLDLLHISYA
jgi:hypothetical protein